MPSDSAKSALLAPSSVVLHTLIKRPVTLSALDLSLSDDFDAHLVSTTNSQKMSVISLHEAIGSKIILFNLSRSLGDCSKLLR